MCGICGLVYRDPRKRPEFELLRSMANTLRHRGPDDEGVEVHGSAGLAFRRLAIQDLSTAGHQPMSNEDKTVWIVFNGEVYNFLSLRKDLENRHHFVSRTDTEVLVHLYEEQGDRMVDMLDGMFAFVILDTVRQRLLMARDPFGIKPFYYGLNDSRFVFGSEIKPLLASGTISREIDKEALNDYFDFHCIAAPRSIFSAVRKLPAAHLMTLDLRTWQSEQHRYWKPEYRPQAGKSLDDWSNEVEQALNVSVRDQMVADVPVGAFLSGGIDSTLVSRAGTLASSQKLRTFTIDFKDESVSEGKYAAQVAAAIHTDPVVRCVESTSIDQLPELVEYYDEPFADSSMLPTFAVSRVTREYVTVALSGDGGDELFTGYNHHAFSHRLKMADRVPDWLSSMLFGSASRMIPPRFRLQQWAHRLAFPHELRRMSLGWTPARKHRTLVMESDYRLNGAGRLAEFDSLLAEVRGLPPVTQSQIFDILLYLPNDILTKVDRASMAHSLEVRVPFLSRKIADLAFRIPEEQRFQVDVPKRVLRHLVARHFGDNLAYRKKQGFGVPLRSWMAEMAAGPRLQQLLESDAVRNGPLDKQGILQLSRDVLGPSSRWRLNRSGELFAVLVFAAWWDRYML
ncbi:MAG: asparagine synthase (glutamine-hydrolyzing) [Planctomycetota bacterium]|nr:asparagine synthase (glutamine-hydrolyzing) [Planctomycetota bacterium]